MQVWRSMPECPETMTTGVDWSVFIRGSAGLGFGYQFNIAKHFTTFSDFSLDNLLTNISSTGSKAWGATGFSLEVGLTADFYVEEKLHDFLSR